MGLDLRWPIGLMFSLIGALLVIYGLATGSNAELYKRSLDININLIWGLVLVVFGGLMTFMAWRDGKKQAQAAAAKQASKPEPQVANRR